MIQPAFHVTSFGKSELVPIVPARSSDSLCRNTHSRLRYISEGTIFGPHTAETQVENMAVQILSNLHFAYIRHLQTTQQTPEPLTLCKK